MTPAVPKAPNPHRLPDPTARYCSPYPVRRPLVRLHHRRRRQRGLRPGGAPVRRPERQRPVAGSRPARRRRRDPRPRRGEPAVPDRLRLELPDRPAAPRGQPHRLLATRQGPGRVKQHQRDDLHPRQPARLPGLAGRARLRRLGLRGPHAVLQEGRGQLARGEPLPRRRRPAGCLRPPVQVQGLRGVHRGRRGAGRESQRRLQRAASGWRGLVPANAKKRPALFGRHRVPAPRHVQAEPHRPHRRPGHEGDHGGRPGDRGELPAPWRAADRQGQCRGHPVRRRDQQSSAADAVRHRPGRAPDRNGD